MSIEKKYNLISFFFSAIGAIFLIYYIFNASTDAVSSDYIRIINYYLDDVNDLKYLFSWEGISRIPFNFLMRYINVKFFNYSMYFDRIIGIIGLFLFNFVVLKYVLKSIHNIFIKFVLCIILSCISFSLIAWEMILNGTGFAHFITIGLIALIFYIYDKFECGYKYNDRISIFEILFSIYGMANYLFIFLARYIFVRDNYGMSSRYAIQYMFLTVGIIIILAKYIDGSLDKNNSHNDIINFNTNFNLGVFVILCIMNFMTSLLFAGSYCVSYLCTLIFMSLLLTIIHVFFDKNVLWKKFVISHIVNILICVLLMLCFLKSNSTGESLEIVGAKNITLIELLKSDITFPVRFVIKSLASSIIGVETFDYAIIYKTITEKHIYIVGIIHLFIIIWTLFIFINLIKMNFVKFSNKKYKSFVFPIIISIFCIFVFITGHITTNIDEIFKSNFRKDRYNEIKNVIVNYENYSDDDLMDMLEYHRNADHIRTALNILKEKKLNVFANN